MADIQAFRGWRYDLAKAGSLSDVVAPPYDVIDPGMQDALYERSPWNVTRIILNRGDDLLPDQTVYRRAAEHLKHWQRDGILSREGVGTIYVYHQTFEHEGQAITRRGFMARVKLEPFGTGTIYPHEQTHSAAKEDRYRLMMACQANLSPIFGIYPDRDNVAQESLENAIHDRTPLTAIDEQGVRHELWMVTDPDAIASAANVLGSAPMYIADGHHRYETSCRIRDELRGTAQPEDESAAADYTLMTCISMDDPGMVVLPTHRLFRGVKPIASTELIQRLAPCFSCDSAGQGPEFATSVWEEIAVEDRQSTLGFYCREDDTWVIARLTDSGVESLKNLATNQSDEWRDLGVSILHKLVMEKLLGHSDLPSPKYVHSVSEVVEGLEQGDADGRDATGQEGSGDPFELACLVMPATLDHVKAISENGERMPAKSTYFYPKLLSGLVINSLD
jgi:uncharacterized protein (DUF1015 family)